jgi:hypothetical protein
MPEDMAPLLDLMSVNVYQCAWLSKLALPYLQKSKVCEIAAGLVLEHADQTVVRVPINRTVSQHGMHVTRLHPPLFRRDPLLVSHRWRVSLVFRTALHTVPPSTLFR